MAYDDPSTWNFVTWWLHAVGAYYLVGFFLYFFKYRSLQQKIDGGDEAAREERNRLVRGFPGNGYAKMLGVKRD